MAAELNPPSWDTTKVKILGGGSGDQATVDSIASLMVGAKGQFSNERFAIFLKPGTHDININVGFYTTVHGLGANPSDTLIETIIANQFALDGVGSSCDNFWRSAENFTSKGTTVWSVS